MRPVQDVDLGIALPRVRRRVVPFHRGVVDHQQVEFDRLRH